MPRKKASDARGSKRARQIAIAILEALSGELGTSEAAEKLGVSLSRYYQLEAQALQGLLDAVEPRHKGPQKTPEREMTALREQIVHLQKELRRHQALLRTAHRSVGLPARTKAVRKKKRGSRGQTVLQTLRQNDKGGVDGGTKRHAETGGHDRSEPAGT